MNSRVTWTDIDLAGILEHAMASAILVTMFHNLLAKIEYSSLVMRQVGGRRPELIRTTHGSKQMFRWLVS